MTTVDQMRKTYEAKLIVDGYNARHAKRMAKLAYPTPQEATMRKARQARKTANVKK